MSCFLEKKTIKELASNVTVYMRGEKYQEEGRVKKIIYGSTTEDGQQIIHATVSGNYSTYNVTLTFDGPRSLKHYKCNCGAGVVWRGACKHVVAALLSLTSAPREADVTRVSLAVGHMTKGFEKQMMRELADSLPPAMDTGPDLSGDIFACPIVNIDDTDSPYLSLDVSAARTKTIHDVHGFCESIKKRRYVQYSKTLGFLHDPGSFEPKSREFINRLMELYEVYNDMSKIIVSQLSARLPQRFYLTGRAMDSLIELYVGEEFIFQKNGNYISPLVTKDDIGIKFSMRHEDNTVWLKTPRFQLTCLSGARSAYVVWENKLYIMDRKKADALILIKNASNLEVASSANPNADEFVFAGRECTRFRRFMLPKLVEYGLVDSDEAGAIVPDLAVRVRLDLDCDGRDIICNARFIYGAAETGPFSEEGASPAPEDTEGYRDLPGEYKALALLNRCGFKEDKLHKIYRMTADDRIYELYQAGFDELTKLYEVYASDAFYRQYNKSTSRGNFGVKLKGNLLELDMGELNYSLADLVDAIGSYNIKKRYHRLRDGRFISFEDEGARQATELLSELDVSKKDVNETSVTMPKSRGIYLNNLLSRNKVDYAQDRGFADMTENFHRYNEMDTQVPDALENIMREYQKTGFRWLKMLSHYGFGGILADDMGLGKTIQMISLILDAKNNRTDGVDGGQAVSLVVTPTSLMYNWEHEFKKFAPEINAVVLAGTPAHRREIFNANDKNVDVFITTYDTLKRDVEAYEGKKFRYAVADEAQYIKNPKTQNAIALKKVQADVKFALTGTPIENSLTELWSIFDFIMPGYLFSQSKFTNQYEAPIVKDGNEDKARVLREHISPFILRRLKTDVLKELPEKMETTLYADMHPEQKKLYMAHMLMAKGELDQVIAKGEFAASQIKILALITRLRQICCHPSLYVEHYSQGSGKLDLALDTIDMAIESGHRILLFSQFTAMLAIFIKCFEERAIPFFYLDGSTPAQERTDMADRFNAGEMSVFAISLKAGGTGLNLVGADVVIHFDPWWNPAVMAQAADRAHRYGQERVVQVINIVAKGSIEEKIMELQEKKKNLVDSVIHEGANFINKLSAEEIKALFQS
jgi:SNF2 family DNA or RNA helicase